MDEIVLPLHVELYGDSPGYTQEVFERNILPQINQLWSGQAHIRFAVPPGGGWTRIRDANLRLGNRLFEVNTQHVDPHYDRLTFEDDQLRGIARRPPSSGIRICIMNEWRVTETDGRTRRPSVSAHNEGTLGAALGALQKFRRMGLVRTIVVRSDAAQDALRLAHEIGHLLIGPGHADQRGYLMSGGTDRIYNRLTEQDINTARDTAQHIPGHRIVHVP